ncbi:MAG: thiamine pyrophosphate-dependent enzyme [Dehalococcoidia bacterium]
MATNELRSSDDVGFAYDLAKSELTDFYRQMLRIRRFEESSANLYMQGHIKGFLHLYIGEEAIAVGSIAALSSNDYVVTHYRDHGHAIAKGMETKTAMAELCGKSTGSSGGKGGSMHLIDASKRFMGGYAIVSWTNANGGRNRIS